MAKKLRIENNAWSIPDRNDAPSGNDQLPGVGAVVTHHSCRPLLAQTWMAGMISGSSPGTAMRGLRVAVSAA
jgi:hypothetical protein